MSTAPAREYLTASPLEVILKLATIAGLLAALALASSASADIPGPKMKANVHFKGRIYVLNLSVRAPREQREAGGYIRISTCGGTQPMAFRQAGQSWAQARKVLYWRFDSVPPRSAGPINRTFRFILPLKGGPSTCVKLFEHIKGYKSGGTVDLITGTA